ncbi:MAG: 1-deoxy-D-xylulose-5-phosphate synthase [Candidatus Cloacimonetes bacterium]|nr:1-deoxy-D-xylulose-5-phosphate synthase [Candidatus Cloacimonadota bacterium]
MLNKIKCPTDVKKLTNAELEKLAEVVRHRIIDVTAKNGGHIGPSLGATDLTIALLKVFNPLKERIVWDVGHQSYAYKILTERNDRFETLRKFNGISGFNNIFESKYDAFGVGHASTSISAALGIVAGNEINGKKAKTVAVIGDGALTGGIAFEALNHAGHLQKNMIVILNDNNMSISKNVGALQAYLADILVSRSYNAVKGKIWDILHRFPPRVRRKLISSAQKIEENVINTFVPNVIFEDFGFKYVGPIDGHDIRKMVKIFRKAKNNMVGPILIHVVTQKGKGYEFAETNSAKFHGLGPFHKETGECVSKGKTSYSSLFGSTLSKIAANQENVVAITAAMTDGTGLANFAKAFPDRFFDVGIAEQHAVTFAGGLATQGIKPFVAIYSTFLQRAFDQVIHDIALQKLPVVFCLDRAGLVGADGATHHGAFDLSFLNSIPNLVIMTPSCAEELVKMMKFAAEYKTSPVVIRYPRGYANPAKRRIPKIKLGKSEIVQKGNKVAFLSVGNSLLDAQEIVKLMKIDFPEINPYLINTRFTKPIDKELLTNLKNEVDIFITLENNAKIGGFGSSISSFFALDDKKVLSFGYPDKFIEHGSVDKLLEMIDLTPNQIYQKIKKYFVKHL